MLQSTARRALTTRPLPIRNAFLASREFHVSAKSSGSDEAFNPQTTRPQEQKEGAAKEINDQGLMDAQSNENPAHSPGSKPRDPQEGGSQGSKPEEGGGGSSRSGASGGGSPPKAGGGRSGGGGGT